MKRHLKRIVAGVVATAFACVMALALPGRIAAADEYELMRELEDLSAVSEELDEIEAGLDFAPMALGSAGGLLSGFTGNKAVTIPGGSSTSGFIDVYFPGSFSSTPQVLATSAATTGGLRGVSVYVSNVTETSFKVRVTSENTPSANQNAAVRWVAAAVDYTLADSVSDVYGVAVEARSSAESAAHSAALGATFLGGGPLAGWAWCSTYNAPVPTTAWTGGVSRVRPLTTNATVAWSQITGHSNYTQADFVVGAAFASATGQTVVPGSTQTCPAWGNSIAPPPYQSYQEVLANRDRALDTARHLETLGEIAVSRADNNGKHAQTRADIAAVKADVAAVKSEIAATEGRIVSKLNGIESQIQALGTGGWSEGDITSLMGTLDGLSSFTQDVSCSSRSNSWWNALTFNSSRQQCALTDGVMKALLDRTAARNETFDEHKEQQRRNWEQARDEANELLEEARATKRELFDEARDQAQRAWDEAQEVARGNRLESLKDEILGGVGAVGEAVEDQTDRLLDKLDELIDKMTGDGADDPDGEEPGGETPSEMPGLDAWMEFSVCIPEEPTGDMCTHGPSIDLGFMVWEIFPCEQVKQLRPALGVLKVVIGSLILVSAGALGLRWILAALNLNAPQGEN